MCLQSLHENLENAHDMMLIWKIMGQIYLVANVNFLSPKLMKEQCPKAIGSLSSRMIGDFIPLSFL